ncbi:hypothetical protein [Streptomyces sp. BE133]|uniref:hypothetical protein n=1 Tax=Streptomyces sp. BE133 TaxID=3002523 RepID=UPI002E770E23|nr:hypothetical protein [Streptomyces sp. BE133]
MAVARRPASVTGPEPIFADEPTAALDPKSAGHVLKLLCEAVDQMGKWSDKRPPEACNRPVRNMK